MVSAKAGCWVEEAITTTERQLRSSNRGAAAPVVGLIPLPWAVVRAGVVVDDVQISIATYQITVSLTPESALEPRGNRTEKAFPETPG